jgi:hypothetical protein
MKVTVYRLTPSGAKELHTFKIDPSKTTYVLPENSELGFSFVVDADGGKSK